MTKDSIFGISFSNKSSRYLFSGGSDHVVRIWDLQRKPCIKWLTGHTETISGVMYNCKDEHLTSINMKGGLILHNLASGTWATELKDLNGYYECLIILGLVEDSKYSEFAAYEALAAEVDFEKLMRELRSYVALAASSYAR